MQERDTARLRIAHAAAAVEPGAARRSAATRAASRPRRSSSRSSRRSVARTTSSATRYERPDARSIRTRSSPKTSRASRAASASACSTRRPADTPDRARSLLKLMAMAIAPRLRARRRRRRRPRVPRPLGPRRARPAERIRGAGARRDSADSRRGMSRRLQTSERIRHEPHSGHPEQGRARRHRARTRALGDDRSRRDEGVQAPRRGSAGCPTLPTRRGRARPTLTTPPAPMPQP